MLGEAWCLVYTGSFCGSNLHLATPGGAVSALRQLGVLYHVRSVSLLNDLDRQTVKPLNPPRCEGDQVPDSLLPGRAPYLTCR